MASDLEPATPKPKAKRISAKLREAIRLLADGTCKSQRAAAERAGISESYFSRALQEETTKRLFLETANRTIVTAAPRAAARMSELMESESSLASFHASRFVLGAVGIKQADTNVSVSIGVGVAVAGYVLDLREPGEPAPKVIDHQEQNRDAN
jgi:hypothetical protein